MIETMRPDIDNLDEYVRNTTARAFAVVASVHTYIYIQRDRVSEREREKEREKERERELVSE